MDIPHRVMKPSIRSAPGSSQPQLMAGPLQWWLRSTRDVRVVESPEVSDLVVSDIFLKQSEDGMAIGWSLVIGPRNHVVIDMCCRSVCLIQDNKEADATNDIQGL